MTNSEPTLSYKVPLKACRNSIIDHNLVTIWLSVEWPEKGGDDPNLVINITNKQPSTPYFQQNPSSAPVNSVHHHHHQHQEHGGSIYQQQYYHSSGINNRDLSNSTTISTSGDHNDVVSTTTTVVYNSSIQPPSQRPTSPVAIQRIKTELKSQLGPLLRRQTTLNQPYLSSQNVIQTPPTNLNDSRLDIRMSTINPTSSLKPTPSVITPHFDFPQPATMSYSPSTLKPSPMRSLICTCPLPIKYHLSGCPIFDSSNQESTTNFPSEPIHRPPLNRSNIARVASAPQTHINTAFAIPPMTELMRTTNLVPFPNPNLMKPRDSSANVTTIISQPASFLNNTQLCPTIKLPSSNPENNFPPSPLTLSHVTIKNQSNYQINPSVPIPTAGQQSTTANNYRPPKKLTIKRISITDQDQISMQSPNLSQQQQIHNPPSLLSSPIQTQSGTFILQNTSPSTDNTLCGPMNDIKLNTTRQSSPHTNINVRSPVELDLRDSQHLTQRKPSPEDIVNQTISEVVDGKGNIRGYNSSTSASPQQQQKSSGSSEHVWELDGSTTTTYSSPVHQRQQPAPYGSSISPLTRSNMVDMPQEVIRPNFTEQSHISTLPAMTNNKKRNRSKSTTTAGSKRVSKLTSNRQQQTTITTTPVTSSSSFINKSNTWPNTPMSSSSGSVTKASMEDPNRYLRNDSSQMPDMDNYAGFDHGSIQIIHPNHSHGIELYDMFPSKMDQFDSSAPSPSPSITSQIFNPTSAEKSSSTFISLLTNPDDVYEDFFPSHLLSSSSPWDDDPVLSAVLTISDPLNNHLPQQQQQQHYPPTDPSSNTNVQSQTFPSHFIETNSTTNNQMNNNDDVQTSSKQPPLQQPRKTSEKTKQRSYSTNNKSFKPPSKISKQRTRPNPTHQQTSIKPRCTRCGFTQLIDITHHEFPKQKGLIFECPSCGNSSIRSNVSVEEQKLRRAKVAADHLNTVECQFCHTIFHSHPEYITHLKDDHGSDKPMKI